MKAGRELDALIAEKVMGVHPFDVREGTVRTYTTNIADAWLVVDRLERMDIEVKITIFPKAATRVDFKDYHTGSEGTVQEYTAPLALCLAALKACGVEVE